MPRQFEHLSLDLEDTQRLGIALGESACPGLVVGLIGQLGAGKTAFTRAVARGLRVPDPRLVNSPTFVLVQEYAGRLTLHHFDVYRLARPDDFEELGIHESFEGGGVCLVEWSNRVEELLPPDRFDIRFEVQGETGRRIVCQCLGEAFAGVFADWQNRIGLSSADVTNVE